MRKATRFPTPAAPTVRSYKKSLMLTPSLIVTAFVIAAGFAHEASAQTGPAGAQPDAIRPTVDDNGVDLFNGTLDVDGPSTSVGGPSNPLSFGIWNYGSGWNDGASPLLQNTGTSVTISIDHLTDTFTGSGPFTSTSGEGSTLTYDGDTIYTYTEHDGTVAQFTVPVGNYWIRGNSSAYLTSIVRPNGEKISYSWKKQTFCAHMEGAQCTIIYNEYRLDDITSTNGFRMKERWPGLSEQGSATVKWIVCRFRRVADTGRHAGRA
jgi:hypothetical protein